MLYEMCPQCKGYKAIGYAVCGTCKGTGWIPAEDKISRGKR